MIVVGSKFLSTEHIQYIEVEQLHEQLYTVKIQMTEGIVKFGIGKSDVMDIEMALELRNRIIRAIFRYKSSNKPEIQYVNFPKYEEVHAKKDSGNS